MKLTRITLSPDKATRIALDERGCSLVAMLTPLAKASCKLPSDAPVTP